MSQKAHETDRQPTGKSPFCCNRDQKVPPRGISKQAKIWANWCVRVSPPPSWAPFSTPELLDAPVWGLTERMRNCLPRSELPSPASARLRVGALDAARPGRRAVAVSVGRKTGCGEETTISPGSLAHEANGSTHNKRQYQPLGSNRQYTCKISSGSMVPCCEFKLSTHHQFYRSASLQTPAIVANEWSSASIAPSSSISAI